jgi:hypothetical protein
LGELPSADTDSYPEHADADAEYADAEYADTHA